MEVVQEGAVESLALECAGEAGFDAGNAVRSIGQVCELALRIGFVEILEETKWLGSWIPIIPVVGKKVYKPVGGEMKRFYYSMIRKARGSQQLLAYIVSQEAEEYGMAPRAPL